MNASLTLLTIIGTQIHKSDYSSDMTAVVTYIDVIQNTSKQESITCVGH